ncbi:DUF4252 domain-containing protein [Chitinophaga eiseniae]|uniref:DUF4252 domain-containing protein n=1 Tax=Chitinophaga eiseniae TaxID=634771 RepID=A0A847SJS9_9BACT|nr:DUF4252 domain-containing protein [Chitinophaga eiseniae]NLR77626.1 DUF4252 domain-containing protein [Chitinophaga eiseniae]
MKAFIIAGCCLLAAVAVKAQDRSLREFRNKYRHCSEVHTISIGGFAMRLTGFCLSFSDDSKDMKGVMRGIQKAKVYTITNVNGNTVNSQDIADLKSNLLRNDHFDELMDVRDKNSRVHILNKGTDDELGKVVMLIQDESDFVIVNLQTTLKMSDINTLIRQFASN